MNDQDIIDATKAAGVELSDGSRAAMRSTLEAAARGEQIAPVVEIGRPISSSRRSRWLAAAVVASAVAAALVVVMKSNEVSKITPATVVETAPLPSATTTTPSSQAVTLDRLIGHRWIVARSVADDGATQPWPNAVLPYVEFSASPTIISGNDGCNTYRATGSLQGGVLRIRSVDSTTVLCDGLANSGALGDGDRLALSADGATLDVVTALGTRLSLVQAESLAPAPPLDGRYATSAASVTVVDFTPRGPTVWVGSCLATWKYENGQLLVDNKSLPPQAPTDCTNGPAPDRADSLLLDKLRAGVAVPVVHGIESDSVILLGNGSPIRLSPADPPLSNDGITVDRASVLGLIAGQQLTADATLAALEARLGPVDHDTGWYATPDVTYADGTSDCLGGKEYRVLWWKDLSLAFWRVEGESLWAWSVGDRRVSGWDDRREPYAPSDPTPSGLATEENIHVGSTEAEMLAAYGDRLTPLSPLPDGFRLYVFTDGSFLSNRDIGISFSIVNGVVSGIGSTRQFC
jgi:META domain